MNFLGDQLLAGSGLALDEHGRIGRRDVFEQGEQSPHLDVAPHERSEVVAVGKFGLDDLFLGQEFQYRATEPDLGAEPYGDLFELAAVDERPIGRSLIAQNDLVALALGEEVLAGYGFIGEHKIASRR